MGHYFRYPKSTSLKLKKNLNLKNGNEFERLKVKRPSKKNRFLLNENKQQYQSNF